MNRVALVIKRKIGAKWEHDFAILNIPKGSTMENAIQIYLQKNKFENITILYKYKMEFPLIVKNELTIHFFFINQDSLESGQITYASFGKVKYYLELLSIVRQECPNLGSIDKILVFKVQTN